MPMKHLTLSHEDCGLEHERVGHPNFLPQVKKLSRMFYPIILFLSDKI